MNKPKGYRALTTGEIAALEAGGSRAEDWSKIMVAPDFAAEAVVRSSFSGEVFLGVFKNPVKLNGSSLPAGIYDSQIHNCRIGDDSLVQQTALLANYDLGAGVSILNCGTISVDGESAFGNGCELEVLNEGGGRELKIFERLSAQLAYLAACYRHRPKLVAAIDKMITAYAESKKSSCGTIGDGATILNCQSIKEVNIGPAATLEGVGSLKNGTILSRPEAPTTVGAGVEAVDFIIGTGSSVTGAAILSSCFVGQGCKLGRQFSAEASAFFANCEGFHGEAVSLLAGPYTVSHHKSTLLIAGVFSFYNAGSGSNQSNHMYKLGPLHQGILDRGAKTGSFSYLLWPARIGAFTAVIGKHTANFDARNLPFSYITDEGGRSVLSPATNLFTVGTRRDGDKWPARDRRSDPEKLDLINFAVFSPLTVGRMIKGLKEITALYEAAPREQNYINYNGIAIKRLLCRTAKKHYEIGIKIYLGSLLAARLEANPNPAEALAGVAGGSADDEWVDLLGLLAPRPEVEALCDAVASGKIKTLSALEEALRKLHAAYREYEWRWALGAWKEWSGKTPAEMTAAELARAITDWRDASLKLNNMILGDARKEFLGPTRIGFGIDGDEAVRNSDFTAVRGTFEENKFVKQLRHESGEIERRSEKILQALEKL